MFTGIITQKAKVSAFELLGGPTGQQGARLRILTGYPDLELGESIAVNGVCLTAVEFDEAGETLFFVGSETLRCTSLARMRSGSWVNLERALKASARLSGHWVQGHVDGCAEIVEIAAEGETYRMSLSLSPELSRYCIEKGSITLNGVSLTVNSVASTPVPSITVHLIPHTWMQTNLSDLKVGDLVNVEVDILAKYVERLCRPYLAP